MVVGHWVSGGVSWCVKVCRGGSRYVKEVISQNRKL